MYCKNCGEFIKETDNYCTSCERPVNRIIPIKEKRKGSNTRITLLIIILITIFISIGIILNVSKIFGSTDLGIKASEKAYNSAMTKFNASIKKLNGYTDIVLTNEEITSLIKYNWPENNVTKNVQIRINENGTVEAAGEVNKNYIAQYLIGNRDKETIKKILPMFDALPEYTDVYAKFYCEIKNNRINFIDIDEIEIMGIQVPSSIYSNTQTRNQMADGINQFIENVSNKTGANFDLVKSKSGKLIVKGKLPELVRKSDLKAAIEGFIYNE